MNLQEGLLKRIQEAGQDHLLKFFDELSDEQKSSFAAELSEPHISRIEQGKQKMYLDTFVRVIEALQVSADYILRSDVPEVNAMYQKEFTDLFIDCTPTEMETLLNIIRQLKSTIRSQKNSDNN